MNIAAIELWGLRIAAILAVMALLFVRGCYVGEERVQVKWDKANAKAQVDLENTNAENRRTEAKRQQRVAAAEAATAQAQLDLATYRAAHPVHLLVGGVRPGAASCDQTGPGKGTGDSAAPATGETPRVLLSPIERDIGNELDDLAAEADAMNDAYGICLATRPSP